MSRTSSGSGHVIDPSRDNSSGGPEDHVSHFKPGYVGPAGSAGGSQTIATNWPLCHGLITWAGFASEYVVHFPDPEMVVAPGSEERSAIDRECGIGEP